MRLGARRTQLCAPSSDGSLDLIRKLYGGANDFLERHRHRYEVNPERVQALEKAGLKFVGRDESGLRMEICELSQAAHPFYVGTQYHPEFLSRPLEPSPPFLGLVLAASGQLSAYMKDR